MVKSLIFTISLLVLPAHLFGQPGYGIGSLQGLKGVNVYVSINSEDTDRAATYRTNALDDIKQLMNAAGIKILTYEELQELDPQDQLLYPTLDIRVMEREPGNSRSDHRSHYIMVSIIQYANLLRNRNLLTNSYGWKTWRRSAMGIVSSGKSESSIRKTIVMFLNDFVQDYYVANPRK